MARLSRLAMSEASWFTRLANRLLRTQSGREPTVASSYGHNPPVLFSFLVFGLGYMRWRSLPARLKRLVHLRTAMRVGCPA